MLEIVAATIQAAERYRKLTFDRLDPLAHTQHGYMMPGCIAVRNDSLIMLSPDAYRKQSVHTLLS